MRKLIIGLLFITILSSYELDEGILNEVRPFLIEENHPVKKALDKIFKENDFRIIQNDASLYAAGFSSFGERHTSGMRVLMHKKLPNYVIKTYLDEHLDKFDWMYCVYRVKGRNAIQEVIDSRNCEKYFTTPKKWIYKIESSHKPPLYLNEQHFLLVAEFIDILPREKNRDKWKTKPNRETLWHLYHIIQDTGAQDCNFVDNIPYCKEGKIAFIDTETTHRWPINFHKLDHYLSPSLLTYWHQLIETGGAK